MAENRHYEVIMYTQNYNTNKANVVSFPNRDYILQMQAQETRQQKSQIENSKQKTIQNTKQQNNTVDSLLILGILLGLNDSCCIETQLFQVIAGILLAL